MADPQLPKRVFPPAKQDAAAAAPAAPAGDARVAAAMANPTFLALPQIHGTVLGILRASPGVTADQAIGMAVSALGTAAPAAPAAPPAAPVFAQPQAVAPVQNLPAPPPGFAYAQAPDGTLSFIAVGQPLQGLPQQSPVQALAGRVGATGAMLVPASTGNSPTGVPIVPGQPAQTPRHDGYLPGDVPGSITLAQAPWSKHIAAANGRAAGFKQPNTGPYIEHDTTAAA